MKSLFQAFQPRQLSEPLPALEKAKDRERGNKGRRLREERSMSTENSKLDKAAEIMRAQ